MPHTRTRARRAKAANTRRQSPRAKTDTGSLLTAGVTFLVGAAVSIFLFLQNPYLGSFETYRLVNACALLFVPLLSILLFLRQSPAQFGLARGDRKKGLKWALVCYIAMLPILVFTATEPEFKEYYGRSLSQTLGYGSPYVYSPNFTPHFYPVGLLYYEMGMAFYMFCWEFFFRGFLLFGLARARFLGGAGAVLLQTIPFTILHWSLVASAAKPPLEIASAFFGGLLLGVLALRTRSFVYGFLVHFGISLTLDLFLLVPLLARSVS